MTKVIMRRLKTTSHLYALTASTQRSGTTLQLNLQDVAGHRFFSVGGCLCAKARPQKKPIPVVEIPGLERITYADRMHYVPGLAKPTFQKWERKWHDPHHYIGPKYEEMPLYKEKPCFVFNQRTSVLEGVKQALWLTKSKMIQGLPSQVLALAEDPANQIENQDERVQQAIRHARFWDTTDNRPARERFCPILLQDLLHLCRTLHVRHPTLAKRMLAEKYSLAAFWNRDADLFQVRGKNGILLNSTSPLPVVAGKEEVASTEDHVLETFYPISPAIDLQRTHVYQEESHTGFEEGYPFPHAHTLFILEPGISPKLWPEQLCAKMIMFAFGNALARAQALYGGQPRVLDQPVVVQSVATNGRIFQFVVFQLNTTDLGPDTGVKNLVWLDRDQQLYEYAKVRPVIRKKEVKVPAGLAGYQPDTFKKFLALYLHGGV
ncbi:39S ribosomal protein L37, mitochondrial [Megalops cyprinoides]|uniref:39S ribosomal protein L37, mitochondrial n=1 Tax=Megalops cyprinoides TaxID=118141 RepID=UPI0018646745|nr:39S ribosomal protein L37, mitochondrial [Megalops cyprinoides]